MTAITTSYVTQAFAMVYCSPAWSLNAFVFYSEKGRDLVRLSREATLLPKRLVIFFIYFILYDKVN